MGFKNSSPFKIRAQAHQKSTPTSDVRRSSILHSWQGRFFDDFKETRLPHVVPFVALLRFEEISKKTIRNSSTFGSKSIPQSLTQMTCPILLPQQISNLAQKCRSNSIVCCARFCPRRIRVPKVFKNGSSCGEIGPRWRQVNAQSGQVGADAVPFSYPILDQDESKIKKTNQNR